MGSGASFDNGLESDNSTRFFCHACRRVFGLGGVISAQDLYCPHCHSTFLEEISTLAGDTALRARAHVDLTEEQSRRLANAATMLRLLESQLRDELEQLQLAYANNTRRNEEEKIRPLTTVMKEKLRRTELSLDMLCSQPNCPICSEDFNIGTKALQLPCSHLFHDHCVMPWLEAKRTCPICRFELTDSVPSMEDLLKFSEVELREKLRGLFVYIQDPLNKSK
jgi:Zn finger protein HypA/HybF involved in hydrogenase expression